MKVLMLSSDQAVNNETSPVSLRLAGYAHLVTELHVPVVGLAGRRIVKRSDNLFIYFLSRWQGWWWQPNFSYDLVTTQDPFLLGLIGWRLARLAKVPLQLQIHTDFLSPYFWRASLKNKAYVLLAKWLLPKADSIRVVSQRIADSLKSALPTGQAGGWRIKTTPIVVPIFVDLEKIKQAPITTNLHDRYPQFTKIILMASRLTKEKNIILAIQSMVLVVKEHPQSGLVIIGQGPEEASLKSLVIKLGLQKNVIFLPWIAQLSSYYKTADGFLITSLYEGYGLTIIEALAAGCPVISTDVGVAKANGTEIVGYQPEMVAQALMNILNQGKRNPSSLNYPYHTEADYLTAIKQSWIIS